MKTIKFVKLNEKAKTPIKAHSTDAGMDVYAIPQNVVLKPHETKVFKTGVAAIIPTGHYLQIQDRSSMGVKGISYAAGVIDEEYRGEIGVVLTNTTNSPIYFMTDVDSANAVKNNGVFIKTDDPSLSGATAITDEDVKISMQNAIAQLILHEVPNVKIVEVSQEEFEDEKDTKRGTKGYGSSNK